MNFWIFKSNPESYDIDIRLKDPAPDIVWLITRFRDEIKARDIVFAWRTGNPRGICAILRVAVNPYKPIHSEIFDGYQRPFTMDPAYQWAKLTIVQPFQIIESSEIKLISKLNNFSFYKAFQQATNFSITYAEGTILAQYIEKARPETRGLIFPIEGLKIGQEETQVDNSMPSGVHSIIPSSFSEYGLYKCLSCGDKMVMGYECEKHVLDIHAGVGVEWKKII
jgi:hypothetical protein